MTASLPALEIAHRYFQAWQRRDPAAIREAFGDGGVYIDTFLSEELTGAAIAAHAARLFTAVPDVWFAPLGETFSGPNGVATEWVMRGTSTGHIPELGGPGAEVTARGADFIRVDDGAIASVQVYYDLNAAAPEAVPVPGKYRKSGLSREDALQLSQRVQHAMTRERLFLDADLTLAALADHLGLSTNHLSQVINGELGCSFSELLNRRRVDEAKRLLSAADAPSVLGVALDVGFRSKSSFYTAFKRYTDMTPSQFIAARR